MPNWFRPVHQVGDIVVVGEEHRKSPSRCLVQEVWDDHEFGAVCAEVHPSDVSGWKNDNGGAVGWSLKTAEKEDIPRYYVDTPQSDIVEAFGGRLNAYQYLSSLEDREPIREDGSVCADTIDEVRDEIREDYGEDAYWLALEKRERLMAQRAQWVANQTDGDVLLVVGSAHHSSIVENLRKEVEPQEVEDRRECTGERIQGGPWTVMLTVVANDFCRRLKQIDWNSLRQRLKPLTGT